MNEHTEKETKKRIVWISNSKANVSNDDLLAKNVKFETKIDDLDTPYEVNIQFQSYNEVLEYAVKRVVWNLQQKAQKKQFLPSNELRTVDSKGNYAKSLRDQVKDLSKEQMLAYMKIMQEMLESENE
jgi:hypothetical protein